MDAGKNKGGGKYSHRLKTDRGNFRMEGGQALDNQAKNEDSPHKGFKGGGPSGSAGGYKQSKGE